MYECLNIYLLRLCLLHKEFEVMYSLATFDHKQKKLTVVHTPKGDPK